jgi:hypothetical protein
MLKLKLKKLNNMTELFGLKDKNGKEYKILVSETMGVGLTGTPWCAPIEKEPKQSKFVIGGWYNQNEIIFCVTGISEEFIYYDKTITPNWGEPQFRVNAGWYYNAKPAAIVEIHTALTSTCERLGLLKEGQKLKSAVGSPFKVELSKDITYNKKHNALYNKGMALYYNGKFAEIVPEKKKLPKTKEELVMLWSQWNRASQVDPKYVGRSMVYFLEDYED